jgi:hypothetical protein
MLGAFDEAVRNVATFAVNVVLPLPKARMIVTKCFPRLTIGLDRISEARAFFYTIYGTLGTLANVFVGLRP